MERVTEKGTVQKPQGPVVNAIQSPHAKLGWCRGVSTDKWCLRLLSRAVEEALVWQTCRVGQVVLHVDLGALLVLET